MTSASYYVAKVIAFCRRQTCCCSSRGAAIAIEHVSHDINAAFISEHKRALYILITFQSLLPIVRSVVHMAGVCAKNVRVQQKKYDKQKKSKVVTTTVAATVERWGTCTSRRKTPWGEDQDGAATLAAAKELEALLCSMIDAFSNGGRGGRASSLTGNYRPLVWRDFIDVERAASKLSQLAFPFTDVCHRQAQRLPPDTPGFVRKSFAKRHLLWGKPVTEHLRQIQEETRRRTPDVPGFVPSMGAAFDSLTSRLHATKNATVDNGGEGKTEKESKKAKWNAYYVKKAKWQRLIEAGGKRAVASAKATGGDENGSDSDDAK